MNFWLKISCAAALTLGSAGLFLYLSRKRELRTRHCESGSTESEIEPSRSPSIQQRDNNFQTEGSIVAHSKVSDSIISAQHGTQLIFFEPTSIHSSLTTHSSLTNRCPGSVVWTVEGEDRFSASGGRGTRIILKFKNKPAGPMMFESLRS